MDVGVLENQDGSVRIVVPAEGYTVQENFDRLGETGVIIDRSTVPTDRILRNAWVLNQTNDGVIVDVAKAKAMVIKANEEAVDKQLAVIQPVFNKAYDEDDTVLLDQIKNDRKNIRATLATKINDINACTTAVQVEAYLP